MFAWRKERYSIIFITSRGAGECLLECFMADIRPNRLNLGINEEYMTVVSRGRVAHDHVTHE